MSTMPTLPSHFLFWYTQNTCNRVGASKGTFYHTLLVHIFDHMSTANTIIFPLIVIIVVNYVPQVIPPCHLKCMYAVIESQDSTYVRTYVYRSFCNISSHDVVHIITFLLWIENGSCVWESFSRLLWSFDTNHY